MNKAVLFLTIFLFATVTYATCDVTDTINKSSSKNYTINNKDYSIGLSLLSNSSGEWIVKFKVNGILTPELEETQNHIFDDLSEIKILSISSSTAQICFNAGLSGLKGTCSSNKDCEDNNPCTIDYCDGDPLRCKHKLILWCRDDDGCCPKSRCTEEKDNDCKLVDECINDSNCDDGNLSTKDICDKNKKCSHIKITVTKCISGDNYCPENCTFTSDIDCDECNNDEDCDDSNACTFDACSGTPKKCFNNATQGCNFLEECIPVGTRIEVQFCHTDNTMKQLKSKKQYCDNNYECLSNQCIKNKCKDISFINKITSWFKGLFSK